MTAPVPRQIALAEEGRRLKLRYAEGVEHALTAEYLRVFSPSAEVRGHGLEEPVLVPGKAAVRIDRVVPVGRYAVRLVFSDGHDTGLYTWDVLHSLASTEAVQWSRYLARLAEHGMRRDSELVKLSALPPQPQRYTPKLP